MWGWGEAHRLALAGGALLTYAWSGFPEEPVLPVDPFIDLVGNALFALGAVAVLAIAIRRVSASERREPPAAANRSLPRGAVSQTEMS
jgi:hypothetical protein